MLRQELKTKGPYSSSGSSHAVNAAVEQGSKYVILTIGFTSYLTISLPVRCTLSLSGCWVPTSHGGTIRAARYNLRLIVSPPHLLPCNTCCQRLCSLDTSTSIILAAVSWRGVMTRIWSIQFRVKMPWHSKV